MYAYCILANTVPTAPTLTNLTFTLDGDAAGSFVHIPTNGTDFQYNIPVYVNSSLPNAQHAITIEATGTNSSLVLFDYLVYT